MLKAVGQKFRRALHFDFHTAPGIEGIFANFDAERFADTLADAHVEYINFTARCNMGFSYYNTKVGKKYAGLGDRDPLLETVNACHKRGIGVTAYLNIGLDHELAADHLDWNKVDREGRIYKSDKKSNFFRTMCYQSGYREHLLSEIRELAAYDIDGLFCDCVTLRECFCPICMADMAKKGVDIESKEAVLAYQDKVRRELCRDIKRAVGDKSLKLYFNGMPWISDLHTHGEIECIPGGTHWGYDYFDSKAAYARTLFEDRVYMSGRFQDEWGDFGGIKSLASMQNDLYDAMMNAFAISFGDHLHPVDGLESEVAKRIKAVFAEKMLYEAYTDNAECIVEVGVLISRKTYKLSTAVKGLSRMLKELKIPYNAYDEDGPFEDVKLLIVPEDTELDHSICKRLAAFAKNGGKLILAGSALELGAEAGVLDFIESIGDDENDNAYYTVAGNDMRWAMYKPCKLVKNAGGEVLADYVDNVFNFIWDGRQSYFYRPQGNPTDCAAAVVGKGAGYICFDICGAYAEMFLPEHKQLFSAMINKLLPERLILAEGLPQSTTVALTGSSAHRVLHVKTTYPEIKMGRGVIEDHVWVKSTPISVAGEYRVFALPESKEIESRTENGRTYFETGDILGYRAFELK